MSKRDKKPKAAKQTTKAAKRTYTERSFEKFFLQFMEEHKEKQFSTKELLAATGLWNDIDNTKSRSILDGLVQQGQLLYHGGGRYQYAQASQLEWLTGRLDVTRSGMGFVRPDDEVLAQRGDVLVKPMNLGEAFHGDLVRVHIVNGRRNKDRAEGRVSEVLERSRQEIVGMIREGLRGAKFLIPDDQRLHHDFLIAEPKDGGSGSKRPFWDFNKNPLLVTKPKDKSTEKPVDFAAPKTIGERKAEIDELVPGLKVAGRLVGWHNGVPELTITRVFGMAGTHNAEIHAILAQYGLSPEFPYEVEKAANEISEALPDDEIRRRRDMRKITTFTIDPYDAKDFDDALSIRELRREAKADGGESIIYEIGVHIADVSYYVPKGSIVDLEAQKRGTSVYLVDRTVPMLPEKLSNNLCSLRPHEDKFTYSAIFEMDEEGNILEEWFGRTVIHSDFRFNYEEAQEVLNGTLTDRPFREELQIMNALAYKLRAQRFATGSIDFDTQEVKFELGEDDRPVRVLRKLRQDTNRLIEDFMLLANKRVANHFGKLFDNPPLPFVYRIHDAPNQEKLLKLRTFVKYFGYEINVTGKAEETARTLNGLITKVQNTREKTIIENLTIRSMAKAVYSTKNIGHYGLGFPYYSHFTSPIRRYPDLMVHRLMTQYLERNFRADVNQLEKDCEYASERERVAAEAERSSIRYKQVEFLSARIGEVFQGVISGVIEHGLFVELQDSMCEGFVPVRSMQDDYYVFDEEFFCLRGRGARNVYRLGDLISVRIVATDLYKRTVEFAVVKGVAAEA